MILKDVFHVILSHGDHISLELTHPNGENRSSLLAQFRIRNCETTVASISP